jgi:Ca-activated chloride channel family protein
MKYGKIFVIVTLAVLLAGISLRFATAQQGPGSQSSETVARPRKKDAPAPTATDKDAPPSAASDSAGPAASGSADEPKIPSKFTKKDKEVPEGLPTFRSDVTTVQLDVAVLDNKGRFIPSIPKGNFRVLEDNVPQQISTFGANGDAPMTIAMVIEFSNLYQRYWSQGWYETLTAAYGFVQTLKPEDYVAIVAYDMRSEILSDFTNDRQKTAEAMQRLRIAGFSEANLYDALVDTEQRMANIEGRKSILLIASGRDTFSKLTFDKARKSIQEAGVPIYAISLLQAARIMVEPYMADTQRMDFLQADNQMNTFSRETGGQAFFPRFYGEFPGIFQSISSALRNQYSIAYQPSNQAKDGKFRKLKVELVDPANGSPLRVMENGKPVKYTIVAKQGYTAPHEVE